MAEMGRRRMSSRSSASSMIFNRWRPRRQRSRSPSDGTPKSPEGSYNATRARLERSNRAACQLRAAAPPCSLPSSHTVSIRWRRSRARYSREVPPDRRPQREDHSSGTDHSARSQSVERRAVCYRASDHDSVSNDTHVVIRGPTGFPTPPTPGREVPYVSKIVLSGRPDPGPCRHHPTNSCSTPRIQSLRGIYVPAR